MATTKELTPEGAALFPHFRQPDRKYEQAGVYGVKLLVTEEKAAALIEKVEEQMLRSFNQAQSGANSAKQRKAVRLAEPPYIQQPDGAVLFTFRRRAERGAPALVDRANQPLPEQCDVQHGSIIRLWFSFGFYRTRARGAGVILHPTSVQLIRPASINKRDAAVAFGFVLTEI